SRCVPGTVVAASRDVQSDRRCGRHQRCSASRNSLHRFAPVAVRTDLRLQGARLPRRATRFRAIPSVHGSTPLRRSRRYHATQPTPRRTMNVQKIAEKDAVATVTEFLEAAAAEDIDRAVSLIADDIAWRNTWLPTIRGAGMVRRIFAGLERPSLGFGV